MNLKYFLKAFGLFILLITTTVLVGAFLGKLVPSNILIIIVAFIWYVGSIWVGYLNTKVASENKYTNALIMHLILSVIVFLVFMYFFPSSIRYNVTSNLIFLFYLKLALPFITSKSVKTRQSLILLFELKGN